MTEVLKTSNQQNLKDSPNVTFLQVSGVGPLPSVLPDGPMIDPYGLGHVLVSLSARQAKAMGLLMSGTYDRPGSISSTSASLQSSLENKLRARLNTDGSILFKMTWKHVATPSGRRFCLLRVSGRRTSGQEVGSWPTPTSNNGTGAGEQGREGGKNLQTSAALTHWPTPTTRDMKDGPECKNVPLNSLLGREVWLATGQTPNGSPAGTEKRGQLNPAHSRWLMGYPPGWCDCAVTAMPSSRK